MQNKGNQPVPFSKILIGWHRTRNFREMPWKGEKDPYKIWISEIILQQTRVEQGLDYYNRFIKQFPTVHILAQTSDQKVYKLWEGLGYYSRCRNLIETGRHIANERGGIFPSDYHDILALKGIGPYTAAAIASFAFNQPRAVVDGNVFRVLSRVYGIDNAIDSPQGKAIFSELANEIMEKNSPGEYNQAIMDFGATVCKPVPDCLDCPFNKCCKGYLENRISDLPKKSKKSGVRKRWMNYLILEHREEVAIRQRSGKDVWRNLYEFILIESATDLSEAEITKELKKKYSFAKNDLRIQSISEVFEQRLSHQFIVGRFIRISAKRKLGFAPELLWIKKDQINAYPFPKFINNYLHKQL